VISVKIADDKGHATESDMLRGLMWVYQNREKYHISVVNLSLGAATPQSYRFSPIDAAVEMLWQSGVTVVASSGNAGTDKTATWSAPGNDPYVITVGCLDDNQTLDPNDDSVCSFSSRGATQDGFAKPNIVAPGRKIYSTLAGPKSEIALQYPDRISPDRNHIRLSGTSMSTPVVTGAAALLLQRFPELQPNQVKWLLDTSARKYAGQPDKAGELDIAAAMGLARRGSVPQANQDLGLGRTQGNGGLGASSWLNAYWDNAYWDKAYWDNAYWDNAYWDNAYWDKAYWDNAYWDNAYWDSAGAID
jgi:serine protease AprX